MAGISVKSMAVASLRDLRLLGVAGAALLLAACDKQPEGQVVAVVNGDEITQQEVNAELGAAQLPEGEQAESVRNTALGNVVNRRLLASVARDEGIEASPDYIIRKRQMEEALLVQMLGQKVARDIKQASAADIDKFIADNPQAFAQRTVFIVDQIRFATPSRNNYSSAMADDMNMTDVVATLNRLGIKFDRRKAQIDSASLNPELFKRVMAVGTKEPIIIPGVGSITVSQILTMQQAPISGADARPVASNGIQQRAVGKSIEDKLKKAKDEAGIEYQPGFGPPPEAGKEVAKGTGAATAK